MGDADVIPGEKLGFCWRTGEGKEMAPTGGPGRSVRGWASVLRARGERAEAGCGVGRAGAREGKAERWTGPALAAGPTRKEKEEKELGSGFRAAGERRGLGRAWGLGSFLSISFSNSNKAI